MVLRKTFTITLVTLIILAASALPGKQESIRDFLTGNSMKYTSNDPASPLKSVTAYVTNEQLHLKLDGFRYQAYIPTVDTFNQTICAFIDSPYSTFHSGFMMEEGNIAKSTAQANKCARKIFGVNLLQPVQKGDLLLPDPQGVMSIFRQLYIRPDETVRGMTASILYRVTYKSAIRFYADTLVMINRNRDIYERNTNFYDFQHNVIKNNPGMKTEFQNKSIGGYTFGSIHRRKLDGSIHVLVNILTRILQDYEPEYYRLNKKFLKAI